MELLLNFQGRQSLHSNTGEALELPDLSRSNARQSIVQTFIDATCLAGYVAHASICFDLFLCISWTFFNVSPSPSTTKTRNRLHPSFNLQTLKNHFVSLVPWSLANDFCLPPNGLTNAWKLVASTSKTNSWTSFPTGERCAGSPAFKRSELTAFNLNQSNEFPEWSTCTN